MVRWKSPWISRVNFASWKSRDVVRYVQEKNCRANFFHINSYWIYVPGYYSTVCVPAREIWVQLVAARPHMSTNILSFLHKFLNERFISINLWPPRSPGLSLLDFFLRATWKIAFTRPCLGMLKNWKAILHGRQKILIKKLKNISFWI